MQAFLIFTLAAPLASFGDVAPGERRVTTSRPGRSGLIGLIAAALGLDRADPRQQALGESLAFAVRIDRAGSLLTDYHTTQTAPARKGRTFATRYQELQSPDRGTILSQRDYRADCAFTIAVLVDEDGPFQLDAIAAAFRRPRFYLSAGRRACPLGLPPAPRRIEAASLLDALTLYDEAECRPADRRRLRNDLGLRMLGDTQGYDLACDARFAELGLAPPGHRRIETRRDEPVDRLRWQFTTRSEPMLRINPSSGAAP